MTPKLRRVAFVAAALAVTLLSASPGRAGHEFPFYASYYPQEITLSVLPPAAAPYDRGAVAAAVGACMTSIEVVDDRYVDFRALDVFTLIADDFFHAGCVVGSDGFGFAPSPQGYRKIPQVGTVAIEDDVEVGANTTIDRAALGVTRIGRGTKLDNLIQVGHNVVIGQDTVIAAQAGISGSCRIGNRVMMGGQTGLAGHIEVGDGVMLGAQAGVADSLSAAESPAWSGTGSMNGPNSVPKNPAVWNARSSSFSPMPSSRWPMSMNAGIAGFFGPSTLAIQEPMCGQATVCGGT